MISSEECAITVGRMTNDEASEYCVHGEVSERFQLGFRSFARFAVQATPRVKICHMIFRLILAPLKVVNSGSVTAWKVVGQSRGCYRGLGQGIWGQSGHLSQVQKLEAAAFLWPARQSMLTKDSRRFES